jgi:hypothetical protein
MTLDTDGYYKYTFKNILSINLLFRDGNSPSGVKGTTQTENVENLTGDARYSWQTASPFYKKEDLSKIDKKINEILKSLDLKKFEEIKNNIDYIKKQLDFMENQKVPEVKNLEMIMSNNIKEIQEKHKEDQNILIAETNNKKINISSVIGEKATEILKINNNGIINNILKKINELKIYDIEDININNYSYYNILVEKQLDFNLNKLDNNLKKLIIEKQGIQKNIDNIKKKLNDNSIYSFIQKESKNPEKIICLLSDKILEKESNGLEVIQNNLTKTILDISFNNMEFFDNIDNKISKQEQLNNYLDQLSSLNNAIEEIKQLKNKEEERYLEFIIFLSKNILEINNIENQVSDLKKIILVLEDKIKNIEIEFSKNLTIMNNNLELDINKQKSTLKEQINLLNVYSDNNRLFDELKSKSAYYNLNLNKYYTYISLTENKLEVEDVLLNLNIEYENKKKIVDQKDENVLDIKNQINSIKEKYNKTINILNEIKAKLEAELGITNKILSDNNRYLPNILDERQFLDGIEFNNLKEFNLQSFYNNFKEIKNFIEKSELFHKIKNDGILNFLFQEDFSKKGIVNSQLSKLNQYSIYRSELFVFSKIDKETEYALSDINLAIASNAIVFGFNTRADNNAKKQAESNNIEIRYYNIIYEIIDDVKAALGGLLSPEQREVITGNIEIREVFTINKSVIAGCMVLDGTVKRNSKIRIIRDSMVVYAGELSGLRRFKDDVKEVKSGYECGLSVKDFTDIKVGDIVEAFEISEVQRTLD